MCSEHRLPVPRNQLYNLFFASHRFVGGLHFFLGGTLMNGSDFFHHFIIFIYILFGVGGDARVHATRAIGVRMPYVYCAFTACSI